MKKMFILLLALVMVFALAACGPKDDAETTTTETTTTENTATETTDTTDTTVDTTDTETDDPTDDTADTTDTTDTAPSGESMAQVLVQQFRDLMAADADQDALTLAEALIGNEIIQFAGGAMEVEAGYLAGFSEEISGFAEAANFGPMMGSIAFVGYIFVLEDGADVDAFMQNLSDLADPRWNICVEADETVIENSGNTVFFLMAPTSLEG